jgi:hypothetical protein
MTDDDDVSLQEAADLTGLSTDALRLRFRRGALAGFRRGRRIYLKRSMLPSCERWTERTATARDRSEINLLREQIRVKDEQIAAMARAQEQLHVLLAQLQERLALRPPPQQSDQRRRR